MTHSTAVRAPGGEAGIVLAGLNELRDRVGTDLGVSAWRKIEQAEVNTFAVITDDEQWIHVDPERARTGPYGTTIAHGFFTLALATGFLFQVCTISGCHAVINYGLDKVRFPGPLPVGSKVRAKVHLLNVKELTVDSFEAVYRLVYEVEGRAKPCCVADVVLRYYS